MKKISDQSVAAIVFNNDKSQLLLVLRRDVPLWVLPGGGIDDFETPEDAAVREVLEESGLKTIVHRHIATYLPMNRLTRKTFLYECRHLTGDLKTGNETRDVAFFPLNNLPKSFFFIHKEWLDDTLKDVPLVTKYLKQVTYTKLFLYFFRHPILVIRAILARLGLPINQ